jgi:pimeloyl-ACP methyl ester carboxylesterase
MNGFGGTPIGGNTSGLVGAPVAEEIARYIGEAGLRRPAIIGHSMGGHIAMQLAARHPEAVSKVMVVDMMPFIGLLYGGPTATSESVRAAADQIRDRLAGLTGAARQQAVEATLATMIQTESRRAEAVRHSLDSDADMSARAMHELITTDLRPELANIKVPVTVLYVRSPALPMTDEQMDAVYRASFANLRGARLTRIPDSRHFIMWDAPERFAQEVRTFLKS